MNMAETCQAFNTQQHGFWCILGMRRSSMGIFRTNGALSDVLKKCLVYPKIKLQVFRIYCKGCARNLRDPFDPRVGRWETSWSLVQSRRRSRQKNQMEASIGVTSFTAYRIFDLHHMPHWKWLRSHDFIPLEHCCNQSMRPRQSNEI